MADPDMIERVAMAVRKNRFIRTRRTVFDETVPPTENELDDARAAIEAMREPTTEMEVTGTEHWLVIRAQEDRAGVIWRSMIDEAISAHAAHQNRPQTPAPPV